MSSTIENSVFDGLQVLCGSADTLENSRSVRPLAPFDESVCAMLAAVSSEIRKTPATKLYPEVLTFAFFCRKANISQLAKRWEGRLDGRVGRGMAFHIAPSNVPVNFAYSLVAGLLAGNACVVKVSSRDFEQVRLICKAFSSVLAKAEFLHLAPCVQVVMYDRDRSDLTEWFSSRCNVRVIWGGDETIRRVKEAPIPPRAVDICFADRYSLGIMNASAVLECAQDRKALDRLAHDFYNDTYLYDQNACTSQRLIIWHGNRDDCERAQELFWSAVGAELEKAKYMMEPVTAVDKLMAACRTSLAIEGSMLKKAYDGRIVRVDIPLLSAELPDLRMHGGFFQEYIAESENLYEALALLAEIVDERYQTIGCFGEDTAELREFVMSSGLRGVDRIVPVGHTADFDLVWDGNDLIDQMSRVIQI